MEFKIFKITISFFAIIIAAFFVYMVSGLYFDHKFQSGPGTEPRVEAPASKITSLPEVKTTPALPTLPPTPSEQQSRGSSIPQPNLKDLGGIGTKQAAAPSPVPKILPPPPIIEVSSKSFEELINSAVVQLYCGEFDAEKTSFSNIARGTGIIISAKGEILTNRHIIYDENFKKARNDCLVFKSPFPNAKSEKPKIYYDASVINYPVSEKFNKDFSEDKYYNDFAILKISGKIDNNLRIDQLFQTSYASEADYAILSPYGRSLEGRQNNDVFNYLPIDWNYQPKAGDQLITMGYGVDAAHIANQITSTIGLLSANVDIGGNSKPQIVLIESNSTQGFSGGALINPQSKGLIGLIGWITNSNGNTSYTAAIFRDFLREMIINELSFDLKTL